MNLLTSDEDLDQLPDGSAGQAGDSEDGDAAADTGADGGDTGDSDVDAGGATDFSLPATELLPLAEDAGSAAYPGWASGTVMSFAELAVEDLPPASDGDAGGGDNTGGDLGDVTTGRIAIDWIVPDDWSDDGWTVDDGSGGDDTGGDGTDDGSGWDDSYDDPVDDGSGGDSADGGDDTGAIDPALQDDGPIEAGDFGDGAICILYLPVDVIL